LIVESKRPSQTSEPKAFSIFGHGDTQIFSKDLDCISEGDSEEESRSEKGEKVVSHSMLPKTLMLSGHRESNEESYVSQLDNSRPCKVAPKSYPIELTEQSHLSSEENYNSGIDEQSQASEGGLANLPRDTPVGDLIFGCGIGGSSLGDDPQQSGLFTRIEATKLGGLPYRKIATTG
jgi:hypothetical protein